MEIVFVNKHSVSIQKETGETKAFELYLPLYGNDGMPIKNEKVKNDNFEQELADFGATPELIEEIKNSLLT